MEISLFHQVFFLLSPPSLSFINPLYLKMPANNKDRKYDIMVWGATGFTGGLVADYLTKTYIAEESKSGESIRVAIAGRNKAKLEGVKARLVGISKKAEAVVCIWVLIAVQERVCVWTRLGTCGKKSTCGKFT